MRCNNLRYSLFLLLVIVAFGSKAQKVETAAGPDPRINNGLVVHPNGDVYASDLFGTGFNGSRVSRITTNGTAGPFASGLSQPAGMVFGPDEVLYVAEFTSGEISKVDESGNVTRFVSGLFQPSDLVFDSDSNLYVTNYGNGTISKVEPNGTISTLITGLNQPVGLAKDELENLYSANLKDGIIYRIGPDGQKDSLTTIPDVPIGFMTYANGKLYVTATGHHKIYQVDTLGSFQILTGTGQQGTINGKLEEAQFTNPDGIAVTKTGDTLFVSENNTNLLRRIVLSNISSIQRRNLSEKFIHPNPASDEIRIDLNHSIDSDFKLTFYDVKGRVVLVQELSPESMENGSLIVQVNQLIAGSYIGHLDGDGEHFSFRFLID
ncbi:MAG: hypothetical protein JJ975_08475 [Bacteroidia bacterium]|nr:hypothetical protein [Bacteroidia bacterium]